MAVRPRRVLFVVVALTLLLLWWQLTKSESSLTQFESGDPAGHAGKEQYSKPINMAHDGTEKKPNPSSAQTPLVNHRMYPISSLLSLPSGTPAYIPKLQAQFGPESTEGAAVRSERMQAVKDAFVHSWKGYKKYAWLKDEVAPLTGGQRTTFGGWAATLVDSLDTLWLMDLKTEFVEALHAVSDINFNNHHHLPINVFETTIRYLGGFLGAYDASNGEYNILLDKAVEVGEMLYTAFDTPNHMPVTRWNKIGAEVAAGDALIAEIGSLSLEFTRLSQLTGNMKYYDAVQRISNHLSDQQPLTKLPGLFPIQVNAREADFIANGVFTIGGMTDSVYEYFPKQYLLLGGLSDQYRKLYENAAKAIEEYILFQPLTPDNDDILFAGTVRAWHPPKLELDPQMQHLSCFAGGMFALGGRAFNREDDIKNARRLTQGCIWAYNSTPTGIMPELFHSVPCSEDRSSCHWDETAWADDMIRRNSFDDNMGDKNLPRQQRVQLKQQRLRLPKGMSAIASRQYLLRPEAIESIFVMYRITGEEKWRETAWSMFQNIIKYTRTEIAFAALEDTTKIDSRQNDKMESFWLAETLKYFYLIFSEPDVLSLDDFVLNTEAHPFKRPS